MSIFSYYALPAIFISFVFAFSVPSTGASAAPGFPDFISPGASTPDTMPEIAEGLIQEENLVGEARLKVLFWKIYDARLYAPERVYSPEKEFALSLVYLRDIKRDSITDRTITEMKKQGFDDTEKLAVWKEKLMDIIPLEVKKGSDITGVRREDGSTAFYMDKEFLGLVDDPAFSGRFFDIWLGADSSVPDMRKKLMGNKS